MKKQVYGGLITNNLKSVITKDIKSKSACVIIQNEDDFTYIFHNHFGIKYPSSLDYCIVEKIIDRPLAQGEIIRYNADEYANRNAKDSIEKFLTKKPTSFSDIQLTKIHYNSGSTGLATFLMSETFISMVATRYTDCIEWENQDAIYQQEAQNNMIYIGNNDGIDIILCPIRTDRAMISLRGILDTIRPGY